MQEYDKSSKWRIQHHGDSILRLAGIHDIESWRALQAELVQPRRLPDGLLEVVLRGEPDSDLFLLELATYPERRLGDQLTEDVMLVYMDRGVLPEIVTVVLHPKGKLQARRTRRLRSRRGLTRCSFAWHVVELWKLPAEMLLQADDVGLLPWVPLAQFSGRPEPIFRQCREIVDRKASPDERVNLLAVMQVLAGLRYNDAELLQILGGKSVMIQSPVIEGLVAEVRQQFVLSALETRFGAVPEELIKRIKGMSDEEELNHLHREAIITPSLDEFAKSLRE